MRGLLFSLLCVLLPVLVDAQTKALRAVRLEEKIQVDGYLNEKSWKEAPKAVDFLERNPTEGKAPQFPTEVSIQYNDYAIYVGAMLYDSAPDSILTQLGERDDDLNADYFTISFDTYNQKLDAFVFSVSASGVQIDMRYSDFSFNAVWQSQVKILENGWSVEMEIPFSALRFPNSDSIVWKLQFERQIRRSRSELQWALVSKNVENDINYWGDLTGLQDLKNPIRLQFSPYLSASVQSRAGEQSYGYGGGADMKYGLSEAFTLDMTLLPDFSQVVSDNIVKNLSPFEVVFAEQRPFFQEGVDLFTKGNLFYSRRIGGVPVGYGLAYDELGANEEVTANPLTSRLINVSKVSGRTKQGTGLGILNAITAETFATVKDTVTGDERQVRTNPVTNYNILTFSQNLKNNSSVFLINLNTARGNGFYDANTTAAGTTLVNKSNSYLIHGTFKLTQLANTMNLNQAFTRDKLNDGTNYVVQLAKIKGAFRATLTSENISPNFNPNDLGVNFQTNYRFHRADIRLNKYNPFWKLNQLFTTLAYQMEQNYTTNQVLKNLLTFEAFTTLSKSFHSLFMNVEVQPGDAINLYESRVDGQIFINPGYVYFNVGVSSDYRRKLAIDGFLGLGIGQKYGTSYFRQGRLAPIIRFSDKFTLRPSVEFLNHDGDVGFGGYDDLGNPVYGRRDIFTLTNIIAGKYLFKNNLSLSLRIRHYWSNGVYQYHADLNESGILVRNDNISANTDFNFNAFNTDLVFAWQVAPGSFLNVVYKSALVSDEKELAKTYFYNVQSVFQDNPLNTITLKFIYFIDVASLKRKRD
ncbi:MAG: DUF5916 domain-containing protein [Bacteroidota bacterium]